MAEDTKQAGEMVGAQKAAQGGASRAVGAPDAAAGGDLFGVIKEFDIGILDAAEFIRRAARALDLEAPAIFGVRDLGPHVHELAMAAPEFWPACRAHMMRINVLVGLTHDLNNGAMTVDAYLAEAADVVGVYLTAPVGLSPEAVCPHMLFDAVRAYEDGEIDALTLVREVRAMLSLTVPDLDVDDARYASTRRELAGLAEQGLAALRTPDVDGALDLARRLRGRIGEELPSAAIVPTAEEEAEFARMLRQDEIEEGIAVDATHYCASAEGALSTTIHWLDRRDDVRAFCSTMTVVSYLLLAEEAAQGAEPASAQPTAASWSRKVH